MAAYPTDDNCIFCKIVAGKIPCFKLYETNHALAFMDINPFNDGHCLVIAKGHYPDLYSMPDNQLTAVAKAARRVATAVRDELTPDGLNLVHANGPGAAQSVFHFHVHVFPRRNGDRASLNWSLTPGDKDAIAALAERIRSKLE